MASPTLEHANTVGWYILEGYPWWPVYICDQFKLRPSLYQLGDGHKRILKKAKDFKKDYALVYYFGSHDFSLVKLNKGILKPWECSEKEMYLKGHPKHLMKKGPVGDELKFAIQEVEDYLSQPEDIRLPPHMVPSDLDPTLEPPPPIERPEEEENDVGEEEEEDDADGGADEEEDAEEDAEDEDDDEGGAKKKKATKKKAATSKKEKKEKEKKELKPKKDKKEKEKKPPKEKKAAVPKEKKEKKEKEKKPATEETPTKLKRQRSSGSLNDEAPASASASASASNGSAAKQAKKEKSTDVKAAAAAAASTTESDEEDMAVVLEREIRWVLSNAQYEELTTKMLRKVLEERLKRDLKQYRDTIKAVVARVIDEEEDAPAEASAAAAGEAKTVEAVKKEEPATASEDVEMKDAESEEPVKDEPAPEPVKAETVEKAESPVAEEPVKKEEEVSEPQPTQEELTAEQLQETVTELVTVAMDDERKILDILKPLKTLADVTKEQLSESGLLPKLVELRVHRKRSVSTAVGELASQWDVEDVIPPPKPVEEKDIVLLKEKLANAGTSHDELLATIMELHEMSLEMSHLKSTGIARVVADLRQHANDKVSIAAKNLRNAWMQLAEKGKQPSNLKKLEKLNEILESDKESEEAKLGVLNKLIKLSLTTQEIIESKIGVTVSKLRKSINEQVVQAALKLRKKWKSEAEAS